LVIRKDGGELKEREAEEKRKRRIVWIEVLPNSSFFCLYLSLT